MLTVINNERGGALLITLAVLGLFTIAALMAANSAQTDIDLSFNNFHKDQAFYIASAGLKRAQSQVESDTTWTAGYADVPYDGGRYWVAVVDSSTNPALFDTVVIRSTAKLQGSVGNVEAWMVPEYARPFDYAMFGRDSVNVSNNSCVDSYNSDSGSYASTQDTLGANVGSNGQVDLENSADIGGKATSALPGGVTIANPPVQVREGTETGVPEKDLDVIDSTEFDSAYVNNAASYGIAGTYTYNMGTHDLTVGGGEVAVLSSGVYYFNNIELTNDARLEVAPGDQVVIYMTGDLNVRNTAQLNVPGNAADMQIFSSGSNFFIGQNTDVKVAFYGPNAYINVRNNTNVYGSFVGAYVDIDNGACIHYDRSLAEITWGKTGRMLTFAWREL